MKKERVQNQSLKLTEISVLLAFIIILGLTPFGYLRLGFIEITLITVPVVVGAITCGPTSGLILGAAFVFTSFAQCLLGTSAFGTMLLSISPLFCFLVTVPTRMLMGWLTGLFFNLINKDNIAVYSVTGLLGSLLNTLFFMSTLIALFWRTDYIQGLASSVGANGIFAFVIAFVGINGLVEAIACTILSAAICRALHSWFNSKPTNNKFKKV